jgi:LacI family transcriptional regulator
VQHHKAGFEAAQMIVDVIESVTSVPRHIVLPVELVVRDSTRPPPSDAKSRYERMKENLS